jgi:hypothetical protein
LIFKFLKFLAISSRQFFNSIISLMKLRIYLWRERLMFNMTFVYVKDLFLWSRTSESRMRKCTESDQSIFLRRTRRMSDRRILFEFKDNFVFSFQFNSVNRILIEFSALSIFSCWENYVRFEFNMLLIHEDTRHNS